MEHNLPNESSCRTNNSQFNTAAHQLFRLFTNSVPHQSSQQLTFHWLQHPKAVCRALSSMDLDTEMIIWTLSEKCKQLHPFNMGLKYSSWFTAGKIDKQMKIPSTRFKQKHHLGLVSKYCTLSKIKYNQPKYIYVYSCDINISGGLFTCLSQKMLVHLVTYPALHTYFKVMQIFPIWKHRGYFM